MSSPVANFRYIGPISRKDLPSRIVDEWEATLKGARTRVLASLARFLDPATGLSKYLDQIADASSDAWEEFINPDYPNAELIMLKQRVKLASAYPSWKTNTQSAFQPDGRFEQGVTANKGKFAVNVKPTIGVVGFKPELSQGPGAKVALIVTGDKRVTRYIASPEDFSGTPSNMFPTSGKFVRPQIVSAYVFGAVLAIYALDAGSDSLRDAAISYTNNILNDVKRLAKTCASGGSFVMELRYNTTYGLHAYTEAVNC
jgi:hypothetical protein